MGVDFWDSATEGFNRGVPLGVRAVERAEEKKYRDRAETRLDSEEARRANADVRQQESHGQQMKLGEKQLESTDIDLEKKKTDRRMYNIATGIAAASGLAKYGKDREAFMLGKEVYDKLVSNGDQALIFNRDDKEDLKLPDGKTWKDFPEGTKHLVVTQKFGTIPYKDAKDFIKELEPYATDPQKILEHERTQREAVDNMNATEKPFRGKDNKLYKKQWELTKTGKVSKDVPYDGVEHMSEVERKVRDVKDIPEKLLNAEGKRVLLGVSKAESPSERIAARDTSKGLRSELEDIILLDKVSEIKNTKKQKEADKILKLFKGGQNKVLVFPDDPDAVGEMTPTEEALAIADGKIKTDPVLVAKAKRFKELMTDSPMQDNPQTAIDTEAKRRGLEKVEDGKRRKPKKKKESAGTTGEY